MCTNSTSLSINQETIANRWYDAIGSLTPTLGAAEVKAHLTELAKQFAALLLVEPPEREKAQAIGGALARDLSADALVLGKTLQVLAQQAVEGLSTAQVAALHPRLIVLLGEIAAGFVQEKDVLVKSLRRQFLSTTSHDMRSPLNAVIGFSRIVVKGVDGPVNETQAQDLATVYESGKKLLDMINSIFNIEKIEIGALEPEVKPFNLAETIDAVVADVQRLIEENDDTLQVRYEDAPSDMQSDPGQIRQILTLLLGRAARFTRQGTLTLTVARDAIEGEDWVRFEVSDTGLGMTPRQVQRFAESTAPETRNYGDIDLMVSQRFCQALGGQFAVESAVNKDSTFTVRIPRVRPTTAG